MTTRWPERTARPHAANFRLLAFSLFCTLGSCSGTEHVQIRLISAANVNARRSVYVLVRTVKESDYRTESYDEVAAKVVHPDESVVDMAVALPGVPLSFSPVPPAAKSRLAVYALFEQPRCGAWRVLLPEGTERALELRLNDGQLCLVGERGECVATACVSSRKLSEGKQ